MHGAQKNFIIQYNGREGSSAIVSALSAQKGINVPLFEELDPHTFEKSRSRKDYPQALDDVFSTGTYSGQKSKSRKLRSLDADEEALTTGFKWRPKGNIREVAKILRKHNVNIFLLLRRDFLNMTCSSYVHRYGNILQSELDLPSHPQFFELKDDAENAERARLINQQEFRLVKALFLKSAHGISAARNRQIGKARLFARAGIPIRLVYYEDFDGNPKEFITSFVSKLDIDISKTYVPFCGFKKVHTTPIHKRIRGLENIEKSRLFNYFKRSYEDAVTEIDKFSVQ